MRFRVTDTLCKLFGRFRKPTLRELCRQEYGDKFAEMYDAVNNGEPIGGIVETIAFIEMVENVKSEHRRGGVLSGQERARASAR